MQHLTNVALPEEMKDNNKVVTAAVQHDTKSFLQLSERMRNSTEVYRATLCDGTYQGKTALYLDKAGPSVTDNKALLLSFPHVFKLQVLSKSL